MAYDSNKNYWKVQINGLHLGNSCDKIMLLNPRKRFGIITLISITEFRYFSIQTVLEAVQKCDQSIRG